MKSLDAARAAGHRLVILVGDPAYYGRMGFAARVPDGHENAGAGRSRAAALLRTGGARRDRQHVRPHCAPTEGARARSRPARRLRSRIGPSGEWPTPASIVRRFAFGISRPNRKNGAPVRTTRRGRRTRMTFVRPTDGSLMRGDRGMPFEEMARSRGDVARIVAERSWSKGQRRARAFGVVRRRAAKARKRRGSMRPSAAGRAGDESANSQPKKWRRRRQPVVPPHAARPGVGDRREQQTGPPRRNRNGRAAWRLQPNRPGMADDDRPFRRLCSSSAARIAAACAAGEEASATSACEWPWPGRSNGEDAEARRRQRSPSGVIMSAWLPLAPWISTTFARAGQVFAAREVQAPTATSTNAPDGGKRASMRRACQEGEQAGRPPAPKREDQISRPRPRAAVSRRPF